MPERGPGARVFAAGAALGALAALSNLYVSLKTGWTLPAMTTAAMVALAGPRRPGAARDAVAFAALVSAAGYMAGGGNAAALPALAMAGGGPSPGIPATAAWFAVVAALGTVLAPLVGRRMVATLRFPTATATAAVLEGLRGDVPSGERHGRALAGAAIAGGAWTAARALLKVPAILLAPGAAGAFGFGLDTSLLLVGAGGLMALRTALSALAGALLTYGVVAPALVRGGLVADGSYRSVVGFMVWPASALLVSSALTELALDLPRLLRRDGSARAAGDRRLAAAALALGAIVVVLERALFGVPWALAILALPASLLVAYVAGRAMGETDAVPTKALAPLAQLAFGLPHTGLAAPAMAPNLTSAVALHAADTMSATKAAALLGTPARDVVRARLAGVLVGAVVVAVAFGVLVPDPRALPTAELPAPAILVWRSVLDVVARGAVPDAARRAMLAAALVGVALGAAPKLLPARVAGLLPSAMGLGSGMVLPASNSIAMTLGGLLRFLGDRRGAGARAVAIAAGVIAGESAIGILVHVLR